MVLKSEEKTYEINDAGFVPAELSYIKDNNFLKIFGISVISFFVILFLAFTIFSIVNYKSTKISKGIFIKNINVSGLSKEQALSKVQAEISKKMPEDIKLNYKDFETAISLEQIEANFNLEEAVNKAYEISNPNNFLAKDIKTIQLLLNNINIEPALSINQDALVSVLDDISTKLPNTIIESSYYIEDNKLYITPGHSGPIVNTAEMKYVVISAVKNLSYSDSSLEIITEIKNPTPIDVDKIHNEIYKKPENAYYTENPRAVFAHKDGLDFNISIDEVKKMIASGEKEEYAVPLKVLTPEVTTNMIGMEAFPDFLSTYSTRYTSNADRTTNLRLAASKINGTVLMPGEVFSYNKVVGRRTIAAGYKDAKIYQDGQVIDGLGGGICQISTTLFNAALYANLEIVERRNHQFVPSYVVAGRDATVVYGSQDFKFKNIRNYPIKINCSVSGGIAKFDIYGLREGTEYNVDVSSKVTSKTSNAINSITYRTLSLNGKVIKNEVVAKDTYKVH